MNRTYAVLFGLGFGFATTLFGCSNAETPSSTPSPTMQSDPHAVGGGTLIPVEPKDQNKQGGGTLNPTPTNDQKAK
jgi:hypothetical protein